MNKTVTKTRNEKETQKLAYKLWQIYKKDHNKKAIIFALEGPLGVGKTQFTKGLAKAMRLKEKAVSPTFVLEAEYDNGKLIHIDAWRMENPGELEGIGLERRVNKKQVMVIEWAEKVRDIIVKQKEALIVWVRFEYGNSDNERVINIENLIAWAS